MVTIFFSAFMAFDVNIFQLSLVPSFSCLYCDSILALPNKRKVQFSIGFHKIVTEHL